nr:hypothetical protein [uncultured Flavobacterium sp.]
MKKKIILFVTFSLFSLAQAQVKYPESSSKVYSKSNEIRLGALKALFGNGLELSYERVLDTNKGFGATLYVAKAEDGILNQNFSVSPYFRFYFTKSEEYGAKGFFAEGFLDFYSGKNYYYNYYGSIDYENGYPVHNGYSEEVKKNFFDTAIGLTLGKKWVNTSGFVLEAKLGYGRNLLKENINDGVLKFDLSVGYRF